MTEARHISQEDLALYAMQALNAEESAAVRAHLHGCAECRAAEAELAGDLALVSLSVEQQPLPAGARDRFLDRIAATQAADDAAGEARTAQARVVTMQARRHNTAAVSMWVAWGAAAALLLIAISLSIRVEHLSLKLQQEAMVARQLKEQNARAQDVMDVLTAPSAQHVLLTAAKVRAVPTGRAVYLAERGSLLFQANNLDPLPQNKTYELWVIPANGKAPIPAGIFRPDAQGNASVVLPPLPRGVPAKAFGVTIEQASGATTPTLPIILAGAAPAAGS